MPRGERRVCLVTDVESYSSRNNTEQLALQKRLREVVKDALSVAGVPWRRVDQQEQGDGLLILLPQKVDEPRTVSRLCSALGVSLGRSNRRVMASRRMRIRAAIGQGITHRGANGWAGDGVLEVCRLCDCEPLRAALSENPGRDLAVVLPHHMYRDLVEREDYPGLSPKDFSRVKVATRPERFSGDAWITLPSGSAEASAPSGGAPDGERSRASGMARSVSEGAVSGGAAVLGAAAAEYVVERLSSPPSEREGTASGAGRGPEHDPEHGLDAPASDTEFHVGVEGRVDLGDGAHPEEGAEAEGGSGAEGGESFDGFPDVF